MWFSNNQMDLSSLIICLLSLGVLNRKTKSKEKKALKELVPLINKQKSYRLARNSGPLVNGQASCLLALSNRPNVSELAYSCVLACS